MEKSRRVTVLLLLFLLCFVSLQTHAEQNEKERRLSRAKELGLSMYVDEEGYLLDEFFEGKKDSELSKMGIDDLIRVMTNEELEIFAMQLEAGIRPMAVTYYQKVSQVNPDTGGTLYTGVFEVDGRLAYCMERSVATPPQGSSTGPWQAVTNENVRKVLYYGYRGPKDSGYTYVETALATGEANGDGDNSLGRKVLAEIKAKPSPPSTFKVWKVETNGGSTQDLAFYTIEENGYGRIQKVSTNPSATTGNAYYSLKGAVYGIYADKACTTLVGTVTTEADGYSNSLSLAPGSYYAKEITAPQGFLLSTEVKNMSITSSQTTTVLVQNVPKPLKRVELTKYRENTTTVLEGAVFEHQKPDGTKEQAVTGADGKIVWKDLQVGEHQIKEVKAPQGYRDNLNVISFVVEETGHIQVTSSVNKGYGDIRTQLDAQGNLCIAVENKIGYRLPETGSAGMALAVVLGAGCCAGALYKQKKYTRQFRRKSNEIYDEKIK